MGRRPHVPAALAVVMREGGRHAWTLRELQAALAERGAPADFSTVFRSMERLEADGQVGRVDLGDGRARFELGAVHHDHLYCEACGALAPLPCRLARAAVTEAERVTGFAVAGHHLVLTGTCSRCRDGGS